MAIVTTRNELEEYCLRKLGAPVIDINVADEQIDDRIDEALEMYQEYHSDATVKMYFKHLVTATDVTNKWIPVPNNVIFVTHLFPIRIGSSSGAGMFDIKYQMMLNDMVNLNNFTGGMDYFVQMKQYLDLINMALNGTPQISYQRRQNRLHVFGDFEDKDIKAGHYLVAEAYALVDPTTTSGTKSIYNDLWLKAYTAALIKRQWGYNLMKFEGMTLPGGVMLNGRQIYDDASAEIQTLEDKLRLDFELPIDFYIG
jgi:hypothetical protein